MSKRRPWYRGFLPGWIVSGSGFNGVTTNTTLAGSGTPLSPLGVAGQPVIFFSGQGNLAASTTLGAANNVYVTGFMLQAGLTFGHITISVATLDAVNLYDVGVYNQAGSLLAHIGAQSLPSTGNQTFAVSGGSKTILPGLYAFAFTGNATTAALKQDSGTTFTWLLNTNVATSAGGVLPASIGALTVSTASTPLGFALS